MGWQACYPDGKKTALTFSYDDGQVHDRRLVALLSQYGLKATFHLNSGILGRDGFVTDKELATIYEGHEIACHGVQHLYLTHLTAEQMIHELWEDRRSLERITGTPITGLSYAFGAYSDAVVNAVGTLGFEYARTVNSSGSFLVEDDFLRWRPTCHHHDAAGLAERFCAPQEYERMQLFYIWGHSFEFARENNWDAMEQLCKQLCNRSDVWYATNIEIKRYLCAVRSVISDADNTTVYNPSAQTVWIKAGDAVIKLLPGETIPL